LNFFTASPPEAEEEKGEGNLSAAQRSIIYAKFNNILKICVDLRPIFPLSYLMIS